MEYLAEADELVLEYLIFRGFTEAYRAFVVERGEDRLQSLNAERVAHQLLTLAKEFKLSALLELWEFLDRRCFADLDVVLAETALRLKSSLFKFYMVNSKRQGRMEKLLQVFDNDILDRHGTDPGTGESTWQEWYALPYCRDPYRHPSFAPYFEETWEELLGVSLHNFLADVFRAQQAPRLLSFPLHGRKLRATKAELQAMESECMRLQEEIKRLRMMLENRQSSTIAAQTVESGNDESTALAEISQKAKGEPSISPEDGKRSSSSAKSDDVLQELQCVAEGHHASRINVCRFAPSVGSSEARPLVTASQDGTVRVWSWRAGSQKLAQDQLIFCPSEALSLDWHPERPELLAIGLANSTVRLWDVQDRCQVNEFIVAGEPPLPFVSEIKLCARRQVLATLSTGQGSTAIRRNQSDGPDRYASTLFAANPPHMNAGEAATLYTQRISRRAAVQLWSITTCQLTATLSESEKYWITSIGFNHNGSLLVTGASDGKVRVFDVQKMACIMEFQVADCAVVRLTLTADETAVVVIVADGGLSQWSLHRVSAPLARIEGSPSRQGRQGIDSSWTSTWKPSGDLVSASDEAQGCCAACSPLYGNVVKIFSQDKTTSFRLGASRAEAPVSIDWTQGTIVAGYESGSVRAFRFSPLQGLR
eukprot:CAMPEP_0171565680 /NCGR_PEP_ID=MMETSP0961-20121227/109_1 /TAXON_ID=87120 /ORGANISM="Aurantiochytrium limacinum, Strain ATCCMYA-1381" /LENGTH=650 /DNA_ID=CAMNT_0012119257 /DNA_START=55 /DNA_END=2007 /DNA_ORIENTATION=-